MIWMFVSSQNSYVKVRTSKMMACLWEWLRSWGWSPHKWDQRSLKETPDILPLMWKHLVIIVVLGFQLRMNGRNMEPNIRDWKRDVGYLFPHRMSGTSGCPWFHLSLESSNTPPSLLSFRPRISSGFPLFKCSQHLKHLSWLPSSWSFY